MRYKYYSPLLILFLLVSTGAHSQYCANFKASYDGVRLKLSGLQNSGKVKVSVTHNGGITYTDITSLLPVGQDNAVLVLKEPVESVLMEGSDLSGTPSSNCSKSIVVLPTNVTSNKPILSIIAPRGVNTIKVANGTLALTASVLPMSISNKSVNWSVVNGTGKATINSSGLVTAQSNGTVTVTATSVLSPSVSKSINIVITGQPNSIVDISSSVSVYPNPVSDFLNIKSDDFITKIELFNLSGELLKQLKFDRVTDFKLDLTDITKGVYVLKFETIEGVVVQKIIKE
jgi:hypothetical protein